MILSRLVFRFLPPILCCCYGITLVLLVYQYEAVGFYATLFRFIAWNGVLALALADRSHLENRERVEALESEIQRALDTVGIRRVEFNDLKFDVARLNDYLARVELMLEERS